MKRPMVGVLLVDAGLTLLLLGITSLVRPLRLLGVRSRGTAALLAGSGLAVFVAGVALPAPVRHVAARQSRLDEILPEYQFSERHQILIHAPPERIFAAIGSVTAREIRFFRLLTWLRSPRWRAGRESILAPPADRPILDVALRSGFARLAEEPNHEVVVGTVLGSPGGISSPEEFARQRSGVSRAAMNFFVEEASPGLCRVTTETRVFSSGDRARRLFAAYWRVIYPGSALIRRMWLAAVRERAERGAR